LRDLPFEVDWGKTAHARISATNVKGTCDYSEVGLGGTIEREPDAPINLREDPLPMTNAFQVSMLWEEGPIYYGANVIDFTLSFD
jgi:hypothetical protein